MGTGATLEDRRVVDLSGSMSEMVNKVFGCKLPALKGQQQDKSFHNKTVPFIYYVSDKSNQKNIWLFPILYLGEPLTTCFFIQFEKSAKSTHSTLGGAARGPFFIQLITQ